MAQSRHYDILYDEVGSFAFTLKKGKYKIECWGASGGQTQNSGGKGAYVSGILRIHDKLKLFAYIGEEGKVKNASEVFNGGGKPYLSDTYRHRYSSCSGGGSTDIRLKGGEWSDLNSLKSRIIVAGAGGGEIIYSSAQSNYEYKIGKGGDAGGIQGRSGNCSQSYDMTSTVNYKNAEGGSQQNGGSGGEGNYGTGNDGELGKGGNSNKNSGNPASGGGGGYFEGGAGGVCSHCLGAGAGGSSFISGNSQCTAISSTYPDGEKFNGTVHFSGIRFYNSVMNSGDESFLSPYGEYEFGHTGNGAVKITLFLPFYSFNLYFTIV